MEDNNDHNHHHDHQITNKNNNINSNGGSGGGGGTPSASSNSRWTPTKEQVSMLEGLYRQGIRTPSAEQIQQITSRLRAFGHIEGKNVFYWFQNHKARQRQKQKQDSVAAYINLNRFLNDKPSTTAHHHHQFPCPNSNVVCGQYYVPIQTQVADPVGTICQQQQIYHQNNIPIKTSSTTTTTPSPSRLPRLEIFQDKSRIFSAAATSGYNHVPQAGHRVGSGGSEMVNDKVLMISKNGTDYRETLALFPLSPTGVLQEKSYCDDRRNISENNVPIRCYNDQLSSTSNYSGFEEGCSPDGGGDRTFYDFFSR